MKARLSSVAHALFAGPRSLSSTSIGSNAAIAGPKNVEKQAARIERPMMTSVGASTMTTPTRIEHDDARAPRR